MESPLSTNSSNGGDIQEQVSPRLYAGANKYHGALSVVAGQDRNNKQSHLARPTSSSKKRRYLASSWTFEERTPNKRFKSIEPDVVLVMGGVEFYHYKAILCLACPFIDTMLSKNVADSKESIGICRLEFQSHDPKDWLMVYSLLDPARTEMEKDDTFHLFLVEPTDYLQAVAKILCWLTFFQMDELVQKYDKMTAEYIRDCAGGKPFPWYDHFCRFKSLNCPLIMKALKEIVKYWILNIVWGLSKGQKWPTYLQHVKSYLLDDQYSDEIWQHLFGNIDFPEKFKVQVEEKENRKSLVGSLTFDCLLEVCGKSMKKPVPPTIILEEVESRGRSKYPDCLEDDCSELAHSQTPTESSSVSSEDPNHLLTLHRLGTSEEAE